MTEPNVIPTTGRIAVIDLGSNSLRLVVFDRLGGALFPLLNERVLCGLGRGIASTGRLNPEGKTLALVNLRRFVALARDEIAEAERLVIVQLSLNPFVVSFHINIKASSLGPAGRGINSISGSCGVPTPRGSFWRRE